MSREHIRFLLGEMNLGAADLDILATQLTAALDGPLLLYLSSAILTQAAPQVSERLGRGWQDLIQRVCPAPMSQRPVQGRAAGLAGAQRRRRAGRAGRHRGRVLRVVDVDVTADGRGDGGQVALVGADDEVAAPEGSFDDVAGARSTAPTWWWRARKRTAGRTPKASWPV